MVGAPGIGTEYTFVEALSLPLVMLMRRYWNSGFCNAIKVEKSEPFQWIAGIRAGLPVWVMGGIHKQMQSPCDDSNLTSHSLMHKYSADAFFS